MDFFKSLEICSKQEDRIISKESYKEVAKTVNPKTPIMVQKLQSPPKDNLETLMKMFQNREFKLFIENVNKVQARIEHQQERLKSSPLEVSTMLESNNFKKLFSTKFSNAKQITNFNNEDPNITNIYPIQRVNKPITLQSLEMKKCAVLQDEVVYLKEQIRQKDLEIKRMQKQKEETIPEEKVVQIQEKWNKIINKSIENVFGKWFQRPKLVVNLVQDLCMIVQNDVNEKISEINQHFLEYLNLDISEGEIFVQMQKFYQDNKEKIFCVQQEKMEGILIEMKKKMSYYEGEGEVQKGDLRGLVRKLYEVFAEMRLSKEKFMMEFKAYKERYFDYQSFSTNSFIHVGQQPPPQTQTIILLPAIFRNDEIFQKPTVFEIPKNSITKEINLLINQKNIIRQTQISDINLPSFNSIENLDNSQSFLFRNGNKNPLFGAQSPILNDKIQFCSRGQNISLNGQEEKAQIIDFKNFQKPIQEKFSQLVLKLTQPRSKTTQKSRKKLSTHSRNLKMRQNSKVKRREKSKSIFNIKKDDSKEENLRRRKSLHYKEFSSIRNKLKNYFIPEDTLTKSKHPRPTRDRSYISQKRAQTKSENQIPKLLQCHENLFAKTIQKQETRKVFFNLANYKKALEKPPKKQKKFISIKSQFNQKIYRKIGNERTKSHVKLRRKKRKFHLVKKKIKYLQQNKWMKSFAKSREKSTERCSSVRIPFQNQ